MTNKSIFTAQISAIVALGGLLMGFDASVISGVNKFVQLDFNLSDIELGFSVSSLTIVAAIAMMTAGPLSDKFGRRILLKVCAIVFTISAIGSALAPNFFLFLLFRMLGGLGVGASLILAPMYIAEIAPPESRGKLVSFNQLNIVIGISLAFFSNYFILSLGDSSASWVETLGIADNNWRWMLGIEAIPAVFYFFGLYVVPESPRWLLMKNRDAEAKEVMLKFQSAEHVQIDIDAVKESLALDKNKTKTPLAEIFKPAFKLVLTIGITFFMCLLAYGFNSATFSLDQEKLDMISNEEVRTELAILNGKEFENDVDYKDSIKEILGELKAKQYESELITAAITINPTLILIGIIGFVACFAISLGPVMWVLFSELFPLKIKGIAISFVGFINSAVSAGVQFVFPWELSTLGSSTTFFIYGVFALIGLIFIVFKLPETKGKSLEELEHVLVK